MIQRARIHRRGKTVTVDFTSAHNFPEPMIATCLATAFRVTKERADTRDAAAFDRQASLLLTYLLVTHPDPSQWRHDEEERTRIADRIADLYDQTNSPKE